MDSREIEKYLRLDADFRHQVTKRLIQITVINKLAFTAADSPFIAKLAEQYISTSDLLFYLKV